MHAELGNLFDMMNSDKKARRKKKKAAERKAKKEADKAAMASGKINIYHDARDDDKTKVGFA